MHHHKQQDEDFRAGDDSSVVKDMANTYELVSYIPALQTGQSAVAYNVLNCQ